MHRIVLIALVLAMSSLARGQKQYPVSDIAANLVSGADAVFRLNEAEFTIESIDRSTYRVHKVITILNKDAAWMATPVVHYDKLSKVESFEAVVYDEWGSEVQKLKSKDIVDQSNIQGYSLYEDNRIKFGNLQQSSYPYTIEYSYQVGYKFLYFIPDWTVLPDEQVAVERSVYTISAPDGLLPRYKQLMYDGEPQISHGKGRTSYQWVFEGYEAQELEVFGDRLANNPKILVAPSRFKYEDYEGNMSTWDELARWQLSLNAGRNDLSPATKAKVQRLAEQHNTTMEKVRAIYEYMQDRTRYVSIQLGIGGFQPFPASSVDENGYGDCKALSFYTKSLLEAAGIEAHYTWIYSGSNPPDVYEDFPDDSFNHIILSVPNHGDTLWLECTSQNIPMGYIGKSNSDRQVLVVTKDGGKIVRTPSYDFEQNLYVTSASINLNKEGHAEFSGTVDFNGRAVDYMGVRHYMHQDMETRKEWLEEFLDIPNYKVVNFEFGEERTRIPKVTLAMDLQIRNAASVSGKRLFIQPNILNQSTFVPPSTERQTPIKLTSAYLQRDTIRIALPEGSFIEKLPEAIELSSPFGEYKAEFRKTETELIYVRSFRGNKGQWESKRYAELVKFYRDVRRADRKKVIVSTST